MKEISEILAKRGHKVTVFTSDVINFMTLETDKPILIQKNNLRVRRFRSFTFKTRPLKNVPYVSWRIVQALDSRSHLLRDITIPLRMLTFPFMPNMLLSIRESWDIIHATGLPFSTMAIAYVASKWRRIPLVYTPFYVPGEEYHEGYSFRKMLSKADAILACSPLEKQIFMQWGVLPEKIHVVGLGVHPALVKGARGGRFREKYGLRGFMILFLGRCTYAKGLFHLMLAMRRVRKRFPEATLVVAGPKSNEYEEFVSNLPKEVRNGTIYAGVLYGKDKADALAACDVLAMPSKTDAFGMAYIEAWLFGKPVIGTNFGAIPYLIKDGVNGILVEFGHVPQISHAIESLLEDANLRRRLGREGREKVLKKYTWKVITDDIERIYEGLLRR